MLSAAIRDMTARWSDALDSVESHLPAGPRQLFKINRSVADAGWRLLNCGVATAAETFITDPARSASTPEETVERKRSGAQGASELAQDETKRPET